MALSREQKENVVEQLGDLLERSKMTVFASYQGLSVSDMQDLRRQATESNTTIKVVKNRLFKLAASQNPSLKDADLSGLNGQLIYAFNDQDEVAPAQTFAKFAKAHPELKMTGAIASDGDMLDEARVKELAALPGKNELIAQVLATISAPLNDTISALAADMHGLLDGLAAHAHT